MAHRDRIKGRIYSACVQSVLHIWNLKLLVTMKADDLRSLERTIKSYDGTDGCVLVSLKDRRCSEDLWQHFLDHLIVLCMLCGEAWKKCSFSVVWTIGLES